MCLLYVTLKVRMKLSRTTFTRFNEFIIPNAVTIFLYISNEMYGMSSCSLIQRV